MYAIVDIAGQQFKVEKDQQIFVHRLDGKEGDKVSFDQVLLIDNGGKIEVGAPAIKDASVTGKIMGHLRGDKVYVFKKKRRKGYQKRNGHRQDFTKIQIESIGEKAVKAAAKKETVKTEAKAATTKSTPKAATKPATKKPAAKATATKTTKSSDTTAAKAPAKKAAPKTKEVKK